MNNIIVISGPSGSGKSTLISRLMAKYPEMVFSTSHTTRPVRGAERDGVEYFFVTREEFHRMIDCQEFVEWAEVYGNFYGTSFKEVEKKSSGDHYLVLDIDVQGAKILKKKYRDALNILLAPPSLEELRRRLEKREQKIDEVFENRLKIAVDELRQYDFYDYIVINDDLDEAFRALESIYIAHRHTVPRQQSAMKEILPK